MSNDDLIEKVVTTIGVNNGNTPGQGGLTYAQADKFIDYMWDATVLGSLVRKKKMRAVEEEIDTVAVGTRLVRGATEAVDTGENQTPTWGKLSLTSKKFRLDYEVSTESLEDNIEGEGLDQHLASMFATQLGNDLEDIAINGDTSSATPGIKVIDGWRKRALAGGHVVDHAGATLDRAALNRSLKAMPRKYMQKRADLRFFTGSNAIQDYLFSLQQVETGLVNPESLAASGVNNAVRTEGPAGFTTANGFGVPIQEVPMILEDVDGDYDTAPGTSGVQLPSSTINHTELWLTFPKNLIWGFKRDITVHKTFVARKDTWEYNIFVRMGVQIENLDAFVIEKNVRIS